MERSNRKPTINNFLLLYYTKQMGLILLWICLVLVTKDTKLWLEHLTHLVAPSIPLFCSNSIFGVICDLFLNLRTAT